MTKIYVSFVECYGDTRNLLELTRSFLTLRSAVRQAKQYQQPASIDSLADLRSYARANHAGRRKNDRAGPFDHARAGMTGKARGGIGPVYRIRSEEHTSELQSLMRISYTVFCL